MPWSEEQKREYARKYRLEHKEQEAARTRKWRATNPDKVRAMNARHRAKIGPDAFRERERERYAKNKESVLPRKYAWKKGSEAYKIRERNRMAEVRRTRRIEAIRVLGGECLRCGYDDERALQFDHKTPVRRREKGTRNHGGCLSPAEFKAIIGGHPHDIQLLCANCHQIKTAEDRATGWLGIISIQTTSTVEA